MRTCERIHCICSRMAARHEVTVIEGMVGATHVMYVCQRTHAACIKHVMHRPPVWHRTMPSGHAACSASYLRRKVHALLMFTCQAPDGAQLGATALLPCMHAFTARHHVTIRNTPCTTMQAWSLPSACACCASSIHHMRASICHQAMVLSAASLPLGVL